MLFDRKDGDIGLTVFYLANSLWSVLWWCNSSCIMFLCLSFYLLIFLLAASFNGLRPLLVACHCQPFCSLANKLRSFVPTGESNETLRTSSLLCRIDNGRHWLVGRVGMLTCLLYPPHFSSAQLHFIPLDCRLHWGWPANIACGDALNF